MNKFENTISKNDLENLQWLGNLIYDTTKLSIPESPKLCVNSFGDFRIFDNETINGQLENNKSYKNIINSIDKGDISGVDYILYNLPKAQSTIFDKILINWRNKIIKIYQKSYQRIEGKENLLQLIISYSKSILIDLDNFFIDEIRRTQLSLMNGEDIIAKLNLEKLKDKVLNNIEQKINTTSSDYIDILKYKNSDDNATNSDDNATNSDGNATNSDDIATNRDDLQLLVDYYVNTMHQKGWENFKDDGLYLFRNHLQMRRASQFEMRSTAESSLKTNPLNGEEAHILADKEIRDPICSNRYIDTNKIECAKDFRDIILAANIVANAGYNIKNIKDAMKLRCSLIDSFYEKSRKATEQKITYIPSLEELEAIRLENIDKFINHRCIEHGDSYITKLLSKLKKFFENKPIISSPTQLDILKKHSFDSNKKYKSR